MLEKTKRFDIGSITIKANIEPSEKKIKTLNFFTITVVWMVN